MKYLLILSFLFLASCASFNYCNKDSQYYDAAKCQALQEANDEPRTYHPGGKY